jgi:hypothetical protein
LRYLDILRKQEELVRATKDDAQYAATLQAQYESEPGRTTKDDAQYAATLQAQYESERATEYERYIATRYAQYYGRDAVPQTTMQQLSRSLRTYTPEQRLDMLLGNHGPEQRTEHQMTDEKLQSVKNLILGYAEDPGPRPPGVRDPGIRDPGVRDPGD